MERGIDDFLRRDSPDVDTFPGSVETSFRFAVKRSVCFRRLQEAASREDIHHLTHSVILCVSVCVCARTSSSSLSLPVFAVVTESHSVVIRAEKFDSMHIRSVTLLVTATR